MRSQIICKWISGVKFDFNFDSTMVYFWSQIASNRIPVGDVVAMQTQIGRKLTKKNLKIIITFCFKLFV